MRAIGVTGGNGFIGTWVCRELKDLGYKTVVFDHIKRSDTWVYPYADEQFYGDVKDESDVFELAGHVDGIIHLAAILGTQETIQKPIPSILTNIVGSVNVFEAATHYDIPVVYIGVGNHFFRNEGATGSYTVSKACAEDYARMFTAYRSSKISVVRPVNAYGPGQSISSPFGSSKVRKIMPSFICRALTDQPIEVYGDGTQISDCVYVQDVAKVLASTLVFSANENIHFKEVIEVGPKNSYTVLDIANFVSEYVSQKTGKSPVDIEHLPMRPGELPNSIIQANTETLHQLNMDAEEFVPLIQGIARTVDYYHDVWLPTREVI